MIIAINYVLTNPTGAISNFEVSEQGLDYIKLKWTISESSDQLLKYTISRDDFWNTDFVCETSSCEYTEHNLVPCHEYSFSIKAYYMVNGNPEATTSISTMGSTLESGKYHSFIIGSK